MAYYHDACIVHNALDKTHFFLQRYEAFLVWGVLAKKRAAQEADHDVWARLVSLR